MALTLTTPNTVLGALQPRGDAAKLALNLAIVVLGTLVLTIAAKINVPVWPVPVTLQTFAVAALAAQIHTAMPHRNEFYPLYRDATL